MMDVQPMDVRTTDDRPIDRWTTTDRCMLRWITDDEEWIRDYELLVARLDRHMVLLPSYVDVERQVCRELTRARSMMLARFFEDDRCNSFEPAPQ